MEQNTLEVDIGKSHYRVIMLVLASNNNDIYKNCRKVWKKYMNIDPEIKVFFTYGKQTPESPLEEYDEKTDLISEDVEESYPVYIHKTMNAFMHIHANYTYDYLVRTNLTTFWDFENLHKHLDILPKTECYSGDGPLNVMGYDVNGTYLSGVDTIVTYNMIQSIVTNKELVDYNIVEDHAMGKYFSGILKVPMLPNRICFFEDIIPKDDILPRIKNSKINNIDHYIVKSIVNREENDLYVYKQLLNTIYNIIFE